MSKCCFVRACCLKKIVNYLKIVIVMTLLDGEICVVSKKMREN